MIASVAEWSIAPSFLKATGIGIKIPSIFLSLGINPPFDRTHIATSIIIPPFSIPTAAARSLWRFGETEFGSLVLLIFLPPLTGED
jgi:hypothetical protein